MNEINNGMDMPEVSKKAFEAAKGAVEATAEVSGKGYERIESGVVNGYKAIETGVVKGYKAVETAVTGTYTKIEDRFVDKFLKKDGETVAEAKARLKDNQG